VRKDVGTRRDEPDDEARLVQSEDEPVPRAERDQRHSGAEEGERRDDDERGEQPQQDVRRPSPNVRRTSAVVPPEPVAGASQLEGHRRDQEHSHEHVPREQRPDREDRHPLDGEKHDQDDRGDRGQALVAGGAGDLDWFRRHERAVNQRFLRRR
jgi:hypothetical protein